MTKIRNLIAKAALALLLAVGVSGVALAQGTVPYQFINAQTGTTYTFLTSDCSKIVTFNNASAIAVTLPAAGTTFFAGCFIDVRNIGTGLVTITPTTSTIDGVTTKPVPPNAGLRIVNNSTNYFTQPAPGIFGKPVGTVGKLTLGDLGPGCLVTGQTPAAWMGVRLTDGTQYLIPAWNAASC